MSEETARRLIALAIGVATIGAGVLTWRAGQISSTANFDDRQSISQQVDEEAIRIEVAVEAARQARQYDRYVVEYEQADALDARAAAARARGDAEGAALLADEAQQLRVQATDRAFASEVFGAATLANSAVVTDEARPFDLQDRIEQLYAAETSGLTSSGRPDPQRWADESDAIRVRVRDLVHWVALLLLAVVLFTVAEVTDRRRLRTATALVGVLLLVVVAVGAASKGFVA
ncbi:MAG: hypothetical protein KDB10_15915 [Acidimicrobiales bacterium]|nr:hypothetical protein [Acidimicrobiales bacterium]